MPRKKKDYTSKIGPGSEIGRFEIITELGDGGYGRVYKAKDPKDDKIVALKLMKPVDELDNKIFEREIHILSRFKNKRVIEFLESGVGEKGERYFTMEYIPGGDLKDVLQTEGQLGTKQVSKYIMEAAEFLCAVEEMGYIYRDMKPENILLHNDSVKMIDFGLSHAPDFDFEEPKDDVYGTPVYIAPEYIIGDKLDIKYDVYSLGVTFFYLISGSYPFDAPSDKKIFDMHLKKNPPTLKRVPDFVAAYVDMMLAKDPAERPHPKEIVTEMGTWWK